MDRYRVIQNRIRNGLNTVALLAIMTAVTGLTAYTTAGIDGLWVASIVLITALYFSAPLHTERLLRRRGARPLTPLTSPRLYRLASEIASQAGLAVPPRLFWEPSRSMNAYATGSRETPVIVFTSALLNTMTLREIGAIIGHEVAHIKNNDLKVMTLADMVRRVTSSISLVAQVLIVLSLPLILSGQVAPAMGPMLIIVFAPALTLMLQMALSRTREFEADLVCCELTGDPEGLAQALYRLEQLNRRHWRNFILLPWNYSAPSWLQTHPPTTERIGRLMELKKREKHGFKAARHQSFPGTPCHQSTGSRTQCFTC